MCHDYTKVAMPTSSFVRRNDHGVGVEITVDNLEIFERRFTRHLWEVAGREARDEFIGC
jgi:hypothetical protein